MEDTQVTPRVLIPCPDLLPELLQFQAKGLVALPDLASQRVPEFSHLAAKRLHEAVRLCA